MSTRRTRFVIRAMHLTAGVAFGLLVYLPSSWSGGLKVVLMVAGVPLAALSGLWLWQHGRFRRWLGRRRGEPAERVRG